MATVHWGRLTGAEGFARTVAIKRVRRHFGADPEFAAMLVDEARLAARIQHPNVVSVLDVVSQDGELLLVMEYVHGATLAQLIRAARNAGLSMPIGVVSSVMVGLLEGLHAAHESVDERGVPLNLVHRDVSPQNVLVGADGITKVFDFGIAKARARSQVTHGGQIKGKLAYVAPEQLRLGVVDRRADLFAAGAVFWEALVGESPFPGETDLERLASILGGAARPPSTRVPGIPRRLDEVVMRALRADPTERFETAREMAEAVEHAVPPASARDTGAWVQAVWGVELAERMRMLRTLEGAPQLPGVDAESTAQTWVGGDSDVALPIAPPASIGALVAKEQNGLFDPSLPAAAGKVTSAVRSRAWSYLLFGAALAVVVVGGALVRRPHPSPASPPTGSSAREPPTVSASGFDPSGTPPPSARPPAEPTALEARDDPDSNNETPDPVPAAGSASVSAGSAGPSVAKNKPGATSSDASHKVVSHSGPDAKPECVPPYYFDDAGIKRFKRDCF